MFQLCFKLFQAVSSCFKLFKPFQAMPTKLQIPSPPINRQNFHQKVPLSKFENKPRHAQREITFLDVSQHKQPTRTFQFLAGEISRLSLQYYTNLCYWKFYSESRQLQNRATDEEKR